MFHDDKRAIINASSLRAFGLLSALALTVASAGALSAFSAQDSPKTPQTPRSPCDVLTKQEVEAVLQAKVSDPVRRADACHFAPAGRPARGVIVTVYWTGGERRMEASRMAERMFRSADTLDKEFGHSDDDVKNLGDDASFPLKTLNVVRGDAFLKIDADLCSQKQAIALARKALARM
jgi:hypothetical protein